MSLNRTNNIDFSKMRTEDLNTLSLVNKAIEYLQSSHKLRLHTDHSYYVENGGDFTEEDAMRMYGMQYKQIAWEFNISVAKATKVYTSFWSDAATIKNPNHRVTSLGKVGSDQRLKMYQILLRRRKTMQAGEARRRKSNQKF
jgi:hypothetical protein